MVDIEFAASFGLEKKTVKISEVSKGAEGYHVYIDKYFYGSLSKIRGEWVHHACQPWFTADDIQAIVEIIEANM
jgi:hypothetical protein